MALYLFLHPTENYHRLLIADGYTSKNLAQYSKDGLEVVLVTERQGAKTKEKLVLTGNQVNEFFNTRQGQLKLSDASQGVRDLVNLVNPYLVTGDSVDDKVI